MYSLPDSSESAVPLCLHGLEVAFLSSARSEARPRHDVFGVVGTSALLHSYYESTWSALDAPSCFRRGTCSCGIGRA
jgi:hypothetical protein